VESDSSICKVFYSLAEASRFRAKRQTDNRGPRPADVLQAGEFEAVARALEQKRTLEGPEVILIIEQASRKEERT
jgi:hypothetical protein